MAFDTSILGLPYFSLDAAAVDKSPSEMVITNNNGETYYIVTKDVYEDGLQQEGYQIVVNEGE
ncbi:PHD/YefM family antitoxin component YafN of YafNO toxin-antitoxin module [Bacillus sp. SORGH_AS 510]|uniref:hypothetical protein n=1 Tax=Bacillus sp. SORGH_AS_0510 TaxID=3041771 RepID=UPI002789DBA0|nr:hypothetical protein [Bacillus sp. SORGH_AS_0510]MDQ1147671.1 PHD/YefM family antitoxin component YafN of YafNO toxin-antitoxin module [Bacillus sp. SORGH_AS_0510]